VSSLLPLERFAVIAAALDAGQPRDAVLAREGLVEEEWLRNQQAFLHAMGQEASRGRSELTARYQDLFVEARKAALRTRWNSGPVSAAPTELVPSPTTRSEPLSVAVASGPPSAPRLTLAQWAALCAEIAVAPERSPIALARYGFDDELHDRERASWDTVFAGDPSIFEEYLARFRHYRDWFLGAAAR
jgi:hypothetical protein